jgi:hypothetical protein
MSHPPALDVVDSSRSIFQGLCGPCPRRPWCGLTWRKQCAIPAEPDHAARHWKLQEEKVRRAGGVAPRSLSPVSSRPELPRVTHILGREGVNRGYAWDRTMGVYARNAIGDLRRGSEIQADYLENRGLLGAPKVLVISGEDGWLNRFCQTLDASFARSVRGMSFSALIGPNLSAYRHAEHRVWLDNRAVCQLFMQFALNHGLPAIFHTYLEDSAIHQEWMVEYLRLNPTQEYIATGFDCKGGNNARFVRRRIRLLERIQHQAGRPISIVLHNIVSRIRIAKMAQEAFPGRVHLVGRSVLLRSLKGSRLDFDPEGRSSWMARSAGHQPGMELFRENLRRLDQALAAHIPAFFDGTAGTRGS